MLDWIVRRNHKGRRNKEKRGRERKEEIKEGRKKGRRRKKM